jgi:hypothetical protein
MYKENFGVGSRHIANSVVKSRVCSSRRLRYRHDNSQLPITPVPRGSNILVCLYVAHRQACRQSTQRHKIKVSVGSVVEKPSDDFQSGCTSLQSHQQWRSVPIFPHPHQHLLSLEFWILPMLMGVRVHLRVVLICISLIIEEH